MLIRPPSESEIRTALLRKISRFSRLTGMSRTAIGLAAVNDGAFVPDVEDGRNVTIGTYQRCLDWLDANWPTDKAVR
jgi:hypothetical protein